MAAPDRWADVVEDHFDLVGSGDSTAAGRELLD